MRVNCHILVSLLAMTTAVAAAPPMAVFDCTKAPNICEGMCFIQKCKRGSDGQHFWKGGFNYAGQGTGAEKKVRDNRRKAIGCGPNNRCTGGTSCDEFPWASTWQGGLGEFVPDGSPPQPSAGETLCVPVKEQSSQGGQVSQIFKGKSAGYSFYLGANQWQGNSNCQDDSPCDEPAGIQVVGNDVQSGVTRSTKSRPLNRWKLDDGSVILQLTGNDTDISGGEAHVLKDDGLDIRRIVGRAE